MFVSTNWSADMASNIDDNWIITTKEDLLGLRKSLEKGVAEKKHWVNMWVARIESAQLKKTRSNSIIWLFLSIEFLFQN